VYGLQPNFSGLPMKRLTDIRSFHPEAATAASVGPCRYEAVENGSSTGLAPALAGRRMR